MTGRSWNRGNGRQEQPKGQCQLLLPLGQTAAWCLSAQPASSSPARGQRHSASHRNQILPRDKILSPLFCGEKTTSAPGQTTESLSEGISGQGVRATSRSWNEEPAGVLAPGVLSPPGLGIPPRTRTIFISTQHSPKDYSSSPRTQHLLQIPPTPDQNHLPTAQHSPGDHSICSRTSPSLQNHSTPLQGPQHPMKDQHRSGVTEASQPHQHPTSHRGSQTYPRIIQGESAALEWANSGGAAGTWPQNLGRQDARGHGQAGICAWAQGGEQAARGGLWWWGCGNAASGSQQDLLGYTLNPPHKRGLFVRTGCWWLSHTCLASRAWRIKDNWFSPDRKYQEC